MNFRPVEEIDGKDCWTRYQGSKVRVAVFYLDGERIALGLSDTRRCAANLDACRAVLANISSALEARGDGREHAGALHVLCRKVTQWKEQVRRDSPMAAPRRAYL